METTDFTQQPQNIVSKIKAGLSSHKKWLSILSLVVLVLGIPLAVWLLQKTQIFAPKAEGEPIQLVADSDCFVSSNPNKVNCASFKIKLTSPLGPPAEQPESCTSDNQCSQGQKCFNYQAFPGTCKPTDTVCAQVITRACHERSICNDAGACTNVGPECVDFPTPCHVPPGWTVEDPNRSPSPTASASASLSPSPTASASADICTTQTISKTPTVNSSTSVTWTYTYPDSTKITTVNFPAKTGIKYSMNGQTSGFGQALNVDLGQGQSQIQFTIMPDAACATFTAPFTMTNNCGTQISDFAGMGSSGAYGAVCQNVQAKSPINYLSEMFTKTLGRFDFEAVPVVNAQPACSTPPGKPVNFQPAQAFSSGTIMPGNQTLSWSPGAGSAPSGYLVKLDDLTESSAFNDCTSGDLPQNSGDLCISNSAAAGITRSFVPGHVYNLVVFARNACGFSPTPGGGGLQVTAAASPSPSATASASLSPSPSTGPQPGTTFYKVAESEAGLEDAPRIPYTEHPTITDFTFGDPVPGVKQIWVEFIPPTGDSRIEHISVELVEPEPVIASLDCSVDISRKDLKLTLNGTRFGAASGKVKSNDKEAQILSWSQTQVTATIKPTESLDDGKLFKVVLTRADGKALPETTCLVNTTVISLGARLFCREPGKFDVSGVKVTLVDENGNKVNEEVTIDKDGLIKGLKTKLQVGKVYAISVKAPFSLRRNALFSAANGTNVITPTEEPNFILPVGDISPVIAPDGKINTLDHAEIVRQWSVLGTTVKTADFNKDTKVNSIDWACMRFDFNKEDDLVPTKAALPSPSLSPGPSILKCNSSAQNSGCPQGYVCEPYCPPGTIQENCPLSAGRCVAPSPLACPTPPVCPAGKTLMHGDPGPDWGKGCISYTCVDNGPENRSAFFLLAPEATGSYKLNSEFKVDVDVLSEKEAANLFVGKISFDTSALEAVKIEKQGVISCVVAPCPSLNWTETTFDNQSGLVSLVAGIPSPGLQTNSDGSPFAKITFKSKKAGITDIALTDQSRIFANSDNANILGIPLIKQQVEITP